MGDLERYASEHPRLYGQFEYPHIVAQSLSGCRGTFLEIGAGDGARLGTLIEARLLGSFDRIIATDLADLCVETIKSKLSVEAIVADAQKLPFPDQSIDFVFSDQVIEHVTDDRAMARETHRVLVHGGRAYMASVVRLRGGFYIYRNNGKWRIDPTHVREYASEAEFSQLFESVGFRVDSVHLWPIRYPFTDLCVALLLRLGFLNRASALDLYLRHKWLARLRQLVFLPIPLYRIVGIVLSRD